MKKKFIKKNVIEKNFIRKNHIKILRMDHISIKNLFINEMPLKFRQTTKTLTTLLHTCLCKFSPYAKRLKYFLDDF